MWEIDTGETAGGTAGEKRGRRLFLREPGGSAIGEAIQYLLQHSEQNHGMTAETELFLFQASRSQLVPQKIQPALAHGEWVICDPFFDPTTVYQAAACNLDAKLVKTLNAFAAGHCIPAVTFVLDIDRDVAQARLGNRPKIRYREESEAFHERVIRAYRDLAQSDFKRLVQIDGRRSADAVEEQIWRQLVDRFQILVRA